MDVFGNVLQAASGFVKAVATTLGSVFGLVLDGLGWLAWFQSNFVWCAILGAILAGICFARAALAESIHDWFRHYIICPDVRDWTCCGVVACGWCIMDICCPFACPKYHPPFAMRIIVLKAKRLNVGILENQYYYVEAWARRNPATTTSYAKYDLLTDTVAWNEPMDLIIYPSSTSILLRVCSEDGELSSVRVPIDAIYEPPGLWPFFTCCGFCKCPRLADDLNLAEYRWPFVQGAPRKNPIKRSRCRADV